MISRSRQGLKTLFGFISNRNSPISRCSTAMVSGRAQMKNWKERSHRCDCLKKTRKKWNKTAKALLFIFPSTSYSPVCLLVRFWCIFKGLALTSRWKKSERMSKQKLGNNISRKISVVRHASEALQKKLSRKLYFLRNIGSYDPTQIHTRAISGHSDACCIIAGAYP